MPLYIAQSGDLERCHACLTDSQMKDRATQLLIGYKSGALVTQLYFLPAYPHHHFLTYWTKDLYFDFRFFAIYLIKYPFFLLAVYSNDELNILVGRISERGTGGNIWARI